MNEEATVALHSYEIRESLSYPLFCASRSRVRKHDNSHPPRGSLLYGSSGLFPSYSGGQADPTILSEGSQQMNHLSKLILNRFEPPRLL